ncbi:hypothetical protein [Streptomyces sp. NPDC007083]|uniref:hypothetical protein n=1 Tax=Streptomyces sp. NPDC007083 TaxID=3156913 RepID=UPI00340CA13D
MVAQRVVSPVFVGRGEELSALAAALDNTAVEQGPAVALLAGGPGSASRGCSRSSRGRWARRSGWSGGCAEPGRDALPLAPLVTALRTLIRVEDVAPGPCRLPHPGEARCGDPHRGGGHPIAFRDGLAGPGHGHEDVGGRERSPVAGGRIGERHADPDSEADAQAGPADDG